MIAIPMLIIWVIGTQALTLLYLIRHSRELETQKIKKYFHLLYLGYRNDKFYWEFVNTFRKFIIIAINVFLSQVPPSYRGMTAVIALIALYRA
mmetsp:Transcript_17097/g.19722  ORF Transcript_17097/g.19722 Transcript_17097/m.19722 type:complete len:93 (+) Transcript_17097:177-455(+)